MERLGEICSDIQSSMHFLYLSQVVDVVKGVICSSRLASDYLKMICCLQGFTLFSLLFFLLL